MSWDRVKLSSVAEIIAGQSPESKYYNNIGQGIPFFQGKADFGVDYPTVRYWCTQPTKIAKPNDILFSVRAPVGPTNICDIEACVGRGLAAIRTGDLLYFKYLYFYFKTIQDKLASQGNGSTFSAITTAVLKDLEIPLPPLTTQKRIAEILDASDALRRKDQELLKKYDELAQVIFINMFGDPVKNEMGWEKMKMEKLMTIQRGGSPRPIDKFIGGTNPWIKIGDGTKGDDVYLTSTKECITDEGLSKTRKLPAGSLIFANCGVSLGFARIITFDGCIHDGWLAFSDLDTTRINKIFLLKALNSITQYFRNSAPEGTQPNLNTGIMKDFDLIIPPIDLQEKFERILTSFKSAKKSVELSNENSRVLFNSLIQKAFNGELVS